MAGLNIPHRSELPHGTFLGDLNRARLDAQQKAKLVEFAENDPRRQNDFTIDFDMFEGYLSQPVDKDDPELKSSIVPYLTMEQRK